MDDSNIYLNSKEEILGIGKKYKLPQDKLEEFLAPDRVVRVKIPILLDSEITIFKGYRSQHNNKLGPYKGGLRFHAKVSRDEVMALSLWMSLKTAIVGIPMGGGKGGIAIDPKELTESQIEEISRIYVRQTFDVLGFDKDIPAPDVNTNPKIMDWMVDEYIKIAKKRKLKLPKGQLYAAFTGKGKQGLAGRTEATGFGGVVTLKELAKKQKIDPSKTTIAVMGFGNVGYYFAYFASLAGFKVVAVSDSKGGIIKKDTNGELIPLDIPLVMKCKMEKGSLSGCYCAGGVCDTRGGQLISNEELLKLPVDILVPAALEDVINENNVSNIKAKIIIEMANGPVTPKAYDHLTNKKVIIVPDILANSGGVACSYFEWEQNLNGKKYKKEDVLKRLEKLMSVAFEKVWAESVKHKCSLKEASYLVALNKIFSK
ncbi:MAG TPA: Glu/Leu/Phe/Val dehydrogenase [Candidatus Saccharimonadales bacterium]|nr:Glu/Leu/Phe/Val dehydrogenase [Candidatus Saccharimonadales bacterium]